MNPTSEITNAMAIATMPIVDPWLLVLLPKNPISSVETNGSNGTSHIHPVMKPSRVPSEAASEAR